MVKAHFFGYTIHEKVPLGGENMSLKIPSLGKILHGNYDYIIGISRNKTVILTIKVMTPYKNAPGTHVRFYNFEFVEDNRFTEKGIYKLVNQAMRNSYKDRHAVKFSLFEERIYVYLLDGSDSMEFTGRFYK